MILEKKSGAPSRKRARSEEAVSSGEGASSEAEAGGWELLGADK